MNMYFVKIIDLPKIGNKFFFNCQKKLNDFLHNLPKEYVITEKVCIEEYGKKTYKDMEIDTLRGHELKKYYEDNIFITTIDVQKIPDYEKMFKASLHPSCLPNPT